jgi:hypothetical protein
MGLDMLVFGLAILALALILGLILNNEDYVFLLLAILLIPLFLLLQSYPPVNSYQYEAYVNHPNDRNTYIIYFNDFTQEGNQILINNYCEYQAKMLSFKSYDVFNKEYVVTLTDNGGKFKYIDRKTGTKYNYDVGATQ